MRAIFELFEARGSVGVLPQARPLWCPSDGCAESGASVQLIDDGSG